MKSTFPAVTRRAPHRFAGARLAAAPRTVAWVFHVVWGIAGSLSCAWAAPPQTWTTNVVTGTFPTESAALTAVRAKGGKYQYAEVVDYVYQTGNATQFTYKANPRNPTIGPWQYSASGTSPPYLQSEEEGNAATLAWYNQQYPDCSFSSLVPVEEWKRQSGIGGISSSESRIHKMQAQNTSACSPTWTVQKWRTRLVECPEYFSWSQSMCVANRIATLSTRPMPCSQCDLRDNPINISLGAKIQKETDFQLGWLDFSRTYKSQSKTPGGLGRHWTHSLNIQLIQGNAAYAAVYPNGSMMVFRNGEAIDGSGAKVTYANNEYSVVSGPERFVFNTFGQASRVENSDGTNIAFTLDNARRISRATHSSGRFLDFIYTPGPESTDVADISDEDGILVSYVYDSIGRLTDAIYRDGTSRHYFYEDANFVDGLTGIRDESEQRYSTYAYDANGLAILSEHANGTQRGVAEYLEDGTTRYTNASGLQESISFTAADPYRKISSSTRDGITTSVTYAANSSDFRRRISTRTDSSGNVEKFEYQTRTDPILGKVVVTTITRTSSTGQSSVRETWKTADTSRVVRQVANGVSTSYFLNARGQPLIIQETDVGTNSSRQSTFRYCDQAGAEAGVCPREGLLLSADGPLPGDVDATAYTYYGDDAPGCTVQPRTCPYRKGDLWKVTNAAKHTIEILSYDGAGRPLSVNDSNGLITDYSYNLRGLKVSSRVRGAILAEDRVTANEYWPTGLLKKVTQPDGATIDYTYDAAQRLIGVADGAGNSITYTLDNSGNTTFEEFRSASGATVLRSSRIFDKFDRITTAADADFNPTDFAYDLSGNLASTTDALGSVTRRQYDPLNRLQLATQDVGGIEAKTAYAYGQGQNLTGVLDPSGLTTEYARGEFGNVVRQTSPDTGVTTLAYDAAGRIISTTDARGVTTSYAYDGIGRPTVARHEGTSASSSVSYIYDSAPPACPASAGAQKGNLSVMEDSSGTTEYCYNSFGEVSQKTQTTSGIPLSLRYSYTKTGKPKSITYPNGSIIEYGYDEQGQVSTVVLIQPSGARHILVSSVDHYPFGPLASLTYGNGRRLTRTLNQNYQTEAIVDDRPDGLRLHLAHDEVGRLRRVSTPNSDAPDIAFSYDALGRLTQVKDAETDSTIDSYAYDATGNRTSVITAGQVTAYKYSAESHRLSSVGGAERTYDENGNTTTIEDSNRRFEYDLSGRLAKSFQNGSEVARYHYNGKGQRVRTQAGANDIQTLYDEAGRWMGDYRIDGTPVQQAVWLEDLPVGLLTGQDGILSYVEPDHLGSPRTVIDPERDVAIWKWDIRGDAFGNTPPDEDPDADGTPFILDMRLPGQRHDSFSGLSYNYFRDYDPHTGRYIQSDPLGLRGGINTYAYVDSSPLTFYDYYGLEKNQKCLAAAAYAGAVCGTLAGGYAGGVLGTAGGAVACSPTGPGAIACAGAGGLTGTFAGGLAGSLAGQRAGQMAGEVFCPESGEKCDKKLDKSMLRRAGIRGIEHDFKSEWLSKKGDTVLFDICGCEDGRVVIKRRNCKGPIVEETSYRWK